MGNLFSYPNVKSVEQTSKITQTPHRYNYGWIRDKPIYNDCIYEFLKQNKYAVADLPGRIDLREKYQMPAVYDQLKLGSCTANALAFAYQFDEIKQNTGQENVFMPSRLFIYYNERKMEGSVDSDAGAAIGDGVTSINIDGVCDEKMWPYDIEKFAVAPPSQTYIEGKKCHSIAQKKLVQNLSELKTAINNDFVIIFGFNVYSSFESDEVAKTGMMLIPAVDEKLLGGHAVAIVGYDDELLIKDKKGAFIVRNSWSDAWGDKGYFYMPYDFAVDPSMASDFWAINQIVVDLSEYANSDSPSLQSVSKLDNCCNDMNIVNIFPKPIINEIWPEAIIFHESNEPFILQPNPEPVIHKNSQNIKRKKRRRYKN
jgi:C1A family cysteine protease